MRSNDSLRRLGANFVKMLVLVMCFATVFAIVMTADLSGIGTDSAGNVAEAAWSGGNTTQIVIEDNSADNVLLHASGKLGSAEFTIPYSVAAGSDHVSMSQDGNWADDSVSFYNGGDSSVWGSRGNGNFTASTDITIITAINVEVPQIILNLIAKGFAVNAKFSATIYTLDYTRSDTGIGILSSNGALSANEARGNGSAFWNTGDRNCKGTVLDVSTSVTSSSNSNLVLMLSRNLGSRDRQNASQITAEGTTITFTITPPESGISDGNAPKYTGAWEAKIFGGKTFVGSDSADFASYRSGSVTANSSSINLDKVATATSGFSVNGTEYAKKLTLNLSDGDDTSPTYYTGLAAVTIQKDGGAQKTIGTTGTESDTDWYATYTVEAARDTGTLTLYFKADGTYNITVSDTGGLPLVIAVTVSGIDSTASVAAGSSDYFGLDSESIYWVFEESAEELSLYGAVSGGTNLPMVWFVDVAYSAEAYSAEDDFPPAPEDKSADISSWNRFAFGANTQLTSSSSVTVIGGGTQDLSLSGYYAMRVYGMDLTGNITNKVYYFKADKTPIAGVDLVEKSYDTKGGTLVSPSDKNEVGILTEENDVWAPSDLTVKISFTPSLSGNRVQIVDADGNEYYVWVYGGAIAKITKANAVDLSSDWTAVGDGSYTRGGAKVSYDKDAGILTLVYSVTGGVIEVSSPFGVMKGADNLWQKATPAYPNEGEAIHILVDTADPQKVVFSDGYMKETSGVMPSGKDRVWYNKDWLYMPKASIDLGDDALYGVYYHIVRYESDFKDYSSVVAAGDTYKKLTTSGWKFVDAATFGTEYSFSDILKTDESGYLAGYYVVYISAVDRAGNVTQSVWGAFVDANEYTLGTQIYSVYRDAFGTDVSSKFVTALGTLKDGEVVAQESYKRGETVYFRVSIPDGYVPYQVFKLNAAGNGVDNPLYTHPDDNTGKAFVESELHGAGYASFESADTLELLIDRADAGELPTAAGGENSGNGLVVFSFRQVVSATPDGSTTYSGTDIEPHITVTDVNNSELETLIVEDFYTLNKYDDNTSGVSGATIRNAGVYYLTLARAHSEYYVLLNPTEYPQGDGTVVRNYSEFTVTRVALGIDASGLGIYGDITADNLSEKITVSGLSGLVGDDIELVGEDIGSGIKNLAGYSAPVWTVAGFSEGYLGAGPHALILSGLNLTNYSLTVGNASVTVTPKTISFAAVGGEAVFGESLPSSVYDITIAKSALTNAEGVAIADTAAAVAEIFGVEASAVREDGDNWIVTLGSEGLKLATSDSDYTGGYLNANAEGYAIALDPTVDISANYNATFQEGGVLVVTRRTVTVTPNENQSFNIKSGEGGTIRVQVTFGDNLEDSLISGYMTVKIPDPEDSGDWAVDLTDLSHIVNPYGETNVLIQAASGTYTVKVYIAMGGTFVITYTGLDFVQEYGYRWDFGKLASTAGNYTIDYRDANGDPQEKPAAPTFVFNVSGYNSENVLANGIGKYYLTPTVTGFDGDSSLKISDYTYEFYYSVDDGETHPVESIQIVPANVTVTAVVNSGVNSKVYGDVEPAWAFTYEFDGLPEEYLTKYGTPSISGIVRANADGTAAGTRYDDAGKYGAFNAGISCKDRNLNVTLGAGALNTVSFVIHRKTITLVANDFVGGDKFFDGTSDASAVANINFPAGAIINNDTVTLSYTANFVLDGALVSAIGDGYEIAFTDIALAGADSGNYTLATTEFTTQGGDFSIIRAKISLTTSYYTLLKVFDGSTAINGDYLTINPDAGLELYKASMVVSGFFSSANAGERVSATLVLTLASLPYEKDHLEDIFGDYESLGVAIAPIDASKPDSGTVITFNGFIGKIEKRTVNAADVEITIATEKVYDGTPDVAVSYDFTEEFKSAITGFEPADVGFEISASVKDEKKDANTTPYDVTLSGATVSGANYVAAADLTDLLKTDADFIIKRRELTLSIEFATAIYSGAMSPTIDGSAIVEGLVAGESATVSSITAIYSQGDTAWSYVDLDQLEGGNYYHDVLVQSYTVTPGTGFDWTNYQFILADGASAGKESGTDAFLGANLLLEGAAILNPRPVNMLVNAVKAQSKVYDGTTTAKLDFSGAFGVGAADGFVSKDHMDAVLKYITYTANFGTANATLSGLKLTWGNFKIDSASASAADKEIIGSYSFGYTGSQTNIATAAQITRAPLAVEFALPEKAYDGSQYLNLDENNVKTTLIGSIVGEPDSYSVVVIAAGYAGDALDVNDNGVNAGFVYGFSLVNDTRADVINYELVFASKTENLEGFTAVADLGANTTLDPSLYYYHFKSYNYWYLNKHELASLEKNAELFAKLNIVSEFNYGNEVMYALEVKAGSSLTTEDESQLEALGASMVSTRRADAYGKITPVQLAFEVITTDGEDYIFNEEAFVKDFDDDDTAIKARYGAPDAGAGTYDFKLKLTYPDGTPIGDVDFEVKGVEVRFADANVGTRKDVIFRILDLVTAEGTVDSKNVTFNADGTYTVPALGTIEKVGINASLNGGDATIVYGTEWDYSVSYKTATSSKTVYIDAEGYAYIATADYESAGFKGTTEGRVTYVTADNGVTFTEGTEGTTYYRLSGKFGQVVPVSGDGSGSAIVRDGKYVGANVGSYSNVIPVGRADNFIITGSDGITVTVDKAQLIVAPTDAAEGEYSYSGTYYGSIPVPALAAQSGLAAWDDFATVVNDLTVGFTLSTATTPTAITRRATPSFALSEGYYKLFVSGEFSNYTVQLGNGSTEYKLYLALPTLAESTFTVKESLTKVYDAKAVTGADILNGLTASDTVVSVGWAEGADCTNAGTANFAGITVKRTIGDYWYVAPGANEADGISWTSATEGTYTITQRALTVRATSSLNFTYDGTDHQLDRSKLAATSAGGVGDTSGFIANADIKLLFNGEEVSAMRDAGGYTVSISLSASDARNYAVTNNVGTIVVARAPITVSVDAASKTYDVTDGVSGNEAIHFTVASGAVGGDSLTEDDFTVTYRDSSGSVVSAIPTAGVYNYTITCADPNYTVVGGGTGNISATISGVSYKSGDTTFAQITFSAPVTVDYKLQDTAIAEGTPYWSIVEENVRALSDENYETNGIVRVQLTANGSTVSSLPDGSSVTIRALLPEGASADDKVFYVNSNGGLTELTDYQIANGYITYTTSYISNLVFVGMPSFVLAWWVYLLIAVLVVLIIAAAILIAVLAKLRRAPDPVEREEEPVEPELVPEPVVAADIAPEAPVIEPVTYDAPAAVSKHGQPPIIGIR